MTATESADRDEHSSGSFYHAQILDKDAWYDCWSEELVTTYHILIDHCQANGLPFLDNQCTFTDFIDFAFQHSSKRPPPW